MTALPQLVAAFHSLVGLAAVFVATATLYAPDAYGIGAAGSILTASLIEMSIGTFIRGDHLYRLHCCFCQAAGVGFRGAAGFPPVSIC